MRYRVRYNHNIPTYFYQDNYVREDKDAHGNWKVTSVVIGAQSTTSHNYVIDDSYSRMYDSIEPPARDVAKACLHNSYKILVSKRVVLTYTVNAGSSTRYNHTLTMSPESFYANMLSTPNGTNLTNLFVNTTIRQRTAGGIPDILALIDNYDLELKSFFSNKVDLGENIAEPDVFIEAIKLIVSPRKTLLHFISTVTKHYGPKMLGKSLGEVLKTFSKDVSGGYLSWVFGYKPVIRDLNKAFLAHRNVERRLNYLMSQQGNFIRVHARQLLNSDEPFASQANLPFGTTAVKRESNGLYNLSCLARVRTDIGLKDKWAAYAEYFGVNDFIGLSWDLIPFSFVVDWITNFGAWWHRHTRLDYGGPFSQIKNQCFTMNTFDSLDIHVQSGPSLLVGANISSTDRLARIVYKRYERSLTVPDEALLASLSRWALFQNITSGALLTQRIPNGLRLFKSR